MTNYVCMSVCILDLIERIDNIIAFAEIIIIYHPDDTIEKINSKLQENFNIVGKYSVD